MTHATATIGKTAYATTVDMGRHTLTSDEPADHGGQDTGPTPSDLLAAALASCTAITLRMYADRKQWPVESVHVDVTFNRAPDKSSSVDRVLKFEGTLTDEQRSRLADIAERTPVTLTLQAGVVIRTTIAHSP
jgi:putative redox protein